MLLAYVERDYPFQLRADFQETYNLNLDRMGVDYSYSHAAILVGQLPRSSRVISAICPDAEWDQATWFLSSIEHGIRVLIWQNTRDGSRGVNAPQPVKAPSDRKREASRMKDFDKDFVMRILGEVDNG